MNDQMGTLVDFLDITIQSEDDKLVAEPHLFKVFEYYKRF